jgi:hypothetical protein
VKSQRAYAEHIIECIRRIAEDSAPGRNAVFASRTLQDAIVRNLHVLCESTQRIGEPHKQRHPEIDWPAIGGVGGIDLVLFVVAAGLTLFFSQTPPLYWCESAAHNTAPYLLP